MKGNHSGEPKGSPRESRTGAAPSVARVVSVLLSVISLLPFYPEIALRSVSENRAPTQLVLHHAMGHYLVETARMNGVNPEAWLTWVLERIAVSLRGGPSFWFEARGVDLALCPTIDTDPK